MTGASLRSGRTTRGHPRAHVPRNRKSLRTGRKSFGPSGSSAGAVVLCQGAQRRQEPAVSCVGTQARRERPPGLTWKPTPCTAGLCYQSPHTSSE